MLGGTPSVNGDFSFTLKVTDNSSLNVTSGTISFPVLSSTLPVISGPAAGSITATGATLTWTTDLSSSSYVCYGANSYPKGNGPGNTLNPAGGCTPEADTAGVTSHTVVLTNLQSNIAYNVYMCSRGISGGVPKDYLIRCTVNSLVTFSTTGAPAGGAADFSASLFGPQNVTNTGCGPLVQGCAFYVVVTAWDIAGVTAMNANNFSYQVTGIPTNSQVHWPNKQDFGSTEGVISTTATTDDTFSLIGTGGSFLNTTRQFMILLNVGGTTPNGSYTMTVTIKAGAGPTTHTYTWPVTVNSNSVVLASPASQPAIPSQSTWAGYMNSVGNTKWLTPGVSGGICPFGTQGLGFYDGQFVMDQIGMYQGISVPWAAGASACRNNYWAYQLQPGTSWNGQAIFVFPDGQFYDCTTYGISTSCAGVHGLALAPLNMVSTSIPYGIADNAREAAFMLRAKRLDYDLGGGITTLSNVQAMANFVIDDVDQYVRDDPNVLLESFMGGIMATSLIEYYEDPLTGNGDPRVPVAVQTLADHMWAGWWMPWDGATGCFFYMKNWWDAGTVDANCGGPSGTLASLSNLIAPIYGWLYYRTGQTKYQLYGDTMFNAYVQVPTVNGIAFQGKEFSQGYMKTFLYVGWRGGLPATTKWQCFMLPQKGPCFTVTIPTKAAGLGTGGL